MAATMSAAEALSREAGTDTVSVESSCPRFTNILFSPFPASKPGTLGTKTASS